MIKISRKHRDKFIGGLITIILTGLGLWIKDIFSKPSKATNQTTTVSTKNVSNTPISYNVNKDSGKQTNVQVSQNNTNKGAVNNEFISGNKTTNNYNQTKNNKRDTSIVNNGFINQGGNGNTYNQTINTKPQPRHLSQNDKNVLLQIPLSKNIQIHYIRPCSECEKYAYEIKEYLTFVGCKSDIKAFYEEYIEPPCRERFCFVETGNDNEIQISIPSQQEE